MLLMSVNRDLNSKLVFDICDEHFKYVEKAHRMFSSPLVVVIAAIF